MEVVLGELGTKQLFCMVGDTQCGKAIGYNTHTNTSTLLRHVWFSVTRVQASPSIIAIQETKVVNW